MRCSDGKSDPGFTSKVPFVIWLIRFETPSP